MPPTTSPSASPSPTATAEAAPTDSPAQANLAYLLNQLELIHPEPFHGIERAEWLAELTNLSTALPGLSAAQAFVELNRVVGLLSRAGRDGHQFVIADAVDELPALPFRTYEFDEGVYITAAMAPYADLVGQRIEAIAGRPIDDVLELLEPLVPRDGPATVPGFRTIFLLRISILGGLGVIEEGPVELTLTDTAGTQDVVSVDRVAFTQWRSWAGDNPLGLPTRDDTLYLSALSPVRWWQLIDSGASLYVRYEQVRAYSTADVVAIAEAGAQPEVERVILDLRQNGGGDNHMYPSLLTALSDPSIDRPGRLFVLTDRLTFSAASNFATELEQSTSAIFAGEAMGGGLNFWNDVRWVNLPDYPIPAQVGVSTRYWQKATPDDPRLTIDPDMPFPVRADDYFAGRDPVLEAITGS